MIRFIVFIFTFFQITTYDLVRCALMVHPEFKKASSSLFGGDLVKRCHFEIVYRCGSSDQNNLIIKQLNKHHPNHEVTACPKSFKLRALDYKGKNVKLFFPFEFKAEKTFYFFNKGISILASDNPHENLLDQVPGTNGNDRRDATVTIRISDTSSLIINNGEHINYTVYTYI